METKEEGTLEVKLTQKQQKNLINKAIKENATEVTIQTGELDEEQKDTTDTVKVTLRKSMVEALREADMALRLKTPHGELRLDADALEVVADQLDKNKTISLSVKKEDTKDYRKVVGTKASVVSVALYAGKDKISEFGDGKVLMKLEIPKSLVKSKLEAVYIAEDGTIQRFKNGKVVTEKTTDKNGKSVQKKYYVFETNHFSVYALAKTATVNTYAKQLKEISAVNKTGVKLTVQKVAATKNTIAAMNLTWKKNKADKVDAYQIYRASSKNGKYTRISTTVDASILSYADNTADSAAGTTYYYKVRGVKKIGGKNYYTKWSNIVAGK